MHTALGGGGGRGGGKAAFRPAAPLDLPAAKEADAIKAMVTLEQCNVVHQICKYGAFDLVKKLQKQVVLTSISYHYSQ